MLTAFTLGRWVGESYPGKTLEEIANERDGIRGLLNTTSRFVADFLDGQMFGIYEILNPTSTAPFYLY
jgi:hypothetical protein